MRIEEYHAFCNLEDVSYTMRGSKEETVVRGLLAREFRPSFGLVL